MSFQSIVSSSQLLANLQQMQWTKPTEIQRKAIPKIQQGNDLVARAQTGSGKTGAFLLPLIERLMTLPLQSNRTHAVVIVPTRELAQQISDVAQQLMAATPCVLVTAYGGVKINPQMMALRQGAHLVVATPGRLIDLIEKNALNLSALKCCVLDEADKLLDLGFQPELQQLLTYLPTKRQTLLFSATFPEALQQWIKLVSANPQQIVVGVAERSVKTVQHWLHPVDKKEKLAALTALLEQHQFSQVLVFVKTKKSANQVSQHLTELGYLSDSVHGDKSQAQRQASLDRFKMGDCQVLVATDVAARGIDISQLPAVINMDLPKVAHDYIHRIGRTGRAGEKGVAISLVCADEIELLRAIETALQRLVERRWLDGFVPNHNLPESAVRPAKKKKPHKKKLARAQQAANSNAKRAQTPEGEPAQKRPPLRRKPPIG